VRRCSTWVSFVLALASISESTARAADWKPAPGNLMTAWAAKVNPEHPSSEYPRPQMSRGLWTTLNGLWDYAITDRDAAQPTKYDGKILVPFCVESALSGVKKPLTGKQWLWYHRVFNPSDLTDGKRLLLHFGAVDWEAVVYVNGKEVGPHRGGYDPFTFDITDALKPTSATNELVVRVWDSTGANGEPHGKQHFDAIKRPGGIMYTPCSGIWQTVWTEVVPAVSIESLKLVPDVDKGVLHVTVNVRGKAEGLSVVAAVFDPELPAATVRDAEHHFRRSGQEISVAGNEKVGREFDLPVSNPKLWSPDHPFLYDFKVAIGRGKQDIDEVDSYFGMRKIALAKDSKGVTRPMLNNKFVFQSGPLDQGFWPDGIYTAPNDEALKSDIEAIKKLGMNMVRKHVKVEPDRWYYWCDKLGLLVWQDMPSGEAGKGGKRRGEDGEPASPDKAARFEAELTAMIESHRNHPSIIMWVVFNEGWGQYDTERLTKWVKQFDPSRLVSNASGWTDRNAGDIIDMHNYPGPGSPQPEETRAAVLGEFGGLGLAVDGHRWTDKNWGYRGTSSSQELTGKYLELWRNVRKLCEEKGLSAAVYTQLTDVETECNGLLTYDRAVTKIDAKQAYDALVNGRFPPQPAHATKKQ
jgi:beta-galactosidase/beta-glucuronidase